MLWPSPALLVTLTLAGNDPQQATPPGPQPPAEALVSGPLPAAGWSGSKSRRDSKLDPEAWSEKAPHPSG